MKKLMYAIVVAACLTGCKVTDNVKELSYSKAHGYFVRNDAPENAPEYYDSKESFDSIFGMAAVMGKDGMRFRHRFFRAECHCRDRQRDKPPDRVCPRFLDRASRHSPPGIPIR